MKYTPHIHILCGIPQFHNKTVKFYMYNFTIIYMYNFTIVKLYINIYIQF